MNKRTRSFDPDLQEDYPGQHITGPDYDTRDREGREPAAAALDNSVLRDAQLQLETAARRLRKARALPEGTEREQLLSEARTLLTAAQVRL